MAGKHLTEEQVSTYRVVRQTRNSQFAAKIASISRSTASRIDNGLWVHRELRTRGPRRSGVSNVWIGDALPYLAKHPEASAKAVYQHLRDIFPLLISTGQKRSIERRHKQWKAQRAHAQEQDYTVFLHSAHQGHLKISLFDEQQRNSPDLLNLIKHAHSLPLKKRNRAILALAIIREIPLVHICRYLSISRSTGKRWAKEFQNGGVKALIFPTTKKFPKYMSEAVKTTLFKVLHCPPKSYNFARTNWRAVDLKAAMGTHGVAISLWTIRRTLRQAGYRWRKAKVSLTSNDPQYREKVEKLTFILKNLQDDQAFFSVDEFGPVSIKSTKGRRLVGPGVLPTVPQWQKSRGRLIVTAALELETNQVTHFYSDAKNTDQMILMIERLRRIYLQKHKIFISWDAASWHISKALNEKVQFLNEWTEHDGAPAIELVPLPSKAQFLNVIESVFSGLSRAVLHNSDFPDTDTAKQMIDEYFENRNVYYKEHPSKAGKTIWGEERCTPVFDETKNYKDPRYR